MKGALKELNESVTAGRSKIAALEANYRKFLESEPSISAAKAKLREIADAQVELRAGVRIASQVSRSQITQPLIHGPNPLVKRRRLSGKIREHMSAPFR